MTFKTAVEGLWRALWNDGNNRHRPEKIAQVIARSTWLEHCRARDIDMCIGYFDKDFDQGRLDLVNDACDAITTQGKTRIVPIFVDARPRASASRA
jgi:hypothetical protein